LDFEQTSVGLKADLPQGGQVREPLADVEIARVVYGDLGAERSTSFVVLLDPRTLVIDIQRRKLPWVMTQVRKRLGVAWRTRRLKVSCTG
jgi:hypothetical protein